MIADNEPSAVEERSPVIETGGTAQVTAKTLYMDHSAFAHEEWWPELQQIIEAHGLTPVLSLWNLYEIGRAGDIGQRNRRLEFIDRLTPTWMVERRPVQRREVERFLWRHHYGVEPPDLLVLTKHLSVVEFFAAKGYARVCLTARQVVADGQFKQLDGLRRLAPDALRTLQSTTVKQRKAVEHELFISWIGESIPDRDPTGRALTRDEKAQLAEFCWQRRKGFYEECRSLAAENALGEARFSNPHRKPEEADGPDLQHAAMALPYCDLFLTRDGYLATCAEQAHQTMGPANLARICRTPDEVASAASSPARS